MNLVVFKYEDVFCASYYDDVFVTFCRAKSRDAAIEGTKSLLDVAMHEAKKYGLPLEIGTAPLPAEDIKRFAIYCFDDAYQRISEEASEEGVTVTTYIEQILDGQHGYELTTSEDEAAIRLIIRPIEYNLIDEDMDDFKIIGIG